MAEPYIQYRTAFSIHWLSVLLIETVTVLCELDVCRLPLRLSST
jgi:hypothetical protein